MSNQSVGNKVQADLTAAVAAGSLPADAQKKAEQLLQRLQQPVRIGVLGLPQSGKSSLINLLVGSEVLPEGVELPTVQVVYGDTPQTTCTLADGTKTVLDHADARQIAALFPAFVEMALPLPALGKISVLELVAPDDPTAQQRAMQWAAKRSDVAIWCTQAFTQHEQALWAQIPDNLKDHAFLMITKADVLASNGMLDDTRAAIDSVAAPEFTQILPIATLSALAARHADGSVDKDQMRSSGGSGLISAVLRQVDQGRQSFVDMADILLRQHASVLAPAEPESVEPPIEEPAHPAEPTVAEKETPTPHVQVVPDTPAEAPAPVEADNVITLHPETREAYEHVINQITVQAHEMIDLAAEAGADVPSIIMAKVVEYVQWLSDYLNEHGTEGDLTLDNAREAAMDAADLVQLMQMEKRDSAAVEALSLMIQLKHELQADLAA